MRDGACRLVLCAGNVDFRFAGHEGHGQEIQEERYMFAGSNAVRCGWCRAKVPAAVTALLCAAPVLAACGSSSSTSSTSAGSGATSTAATAAAGKKLSVGLVLFSGADVSSTELINGFATYAKQQGWKADTVDSQGSPADAISTIENLVTKKVDLIVTTVYAPKQLAGGILQAKAAGIPVMSLDGGAGPGIQYFSDAGTAPGKAIAPLIMKDTGGQGDLLSFTYPDGLPCVGRAKAVDDAAATASFSSLTHEAAKVPGTVPAAQTVTQAWLAKHPDSGQKRAIFGCWDDPVLGAVAALREAGLKQGDVLVYGINAEAPALQAVKSGWMRATVSIDPYGTGVAAAKAAQKVVADGVDAKPVVAAVPTKVITKENLAEYLEAHPDAVPGKN
jgi:ribose transport system substrate-binding protein